MLNETYDYMLDLFKEFKTIFKDDFIHLGMDEVYYSCWRSNPDIIEWMKKNNMTSLHEIEQVSSYYESYLMIIIINYNQKNRSKPKLISFCHPTPVQYYVERTLDNIKNKVKTRYQQWQGKRFYAI